MKKSIFKTLLPFLAVALVGVVFATSCEKAEEKQDIPTNTQNPPDISQIDTTIVNPNNQVMLSLTPDSIRNLLVGSWQEKYYGWHHYYSDDNIRDTLTFSGNDSIVYDKTNIFSNYKFNVLTSNTIQFAKDSTSRVFDFSLSIDTTTNQLEIMFYNYINLCITCDVKNITYTKLK